MLPIRLRQMTPAAEVDALLDDALAGHAATELHVPVTVTRRWRTPPDRLELSARYRVAPPHVRIEAAGVAFDLEAPVRLEPVVVAKPWGREVWYSGIEARGESRVVTSGGTLALSTYLALAPRRLGGDHPVTLIKRLEPRPQPLLGELYFEVHRQKHELYVVTAVDRSLYPDGAGELLLGLDQRKRREFPDDNACRSALGAALAAYEAARRAVDASGSPDAAALAREADTRRRARAFAALTTVHEGDVVVVPAGIPHALQPGVQVVELQTPTYEREILWSTRQVLTQDRWDGARAVQWLSLDPAPSPRIEDPGKAAQHIAAFADFGVSRITLSAGCAFEIPPGISQALCVCLEGAARIATTAGCLTLEAGEVALLPAAANSRTLEAAGASAQLLLTAPELGEYGNPEDRC